ncbi:hypothetical protein [Streptomyces albireticuli]
MTAPQAAPEGPRYSTRREFRSGETVPLGAYSIDTSMFPTY